MTLSFSRSAVLAAVLLPSALPAFAAEEHAGVPGIACVRVAEPPTIDGRLDDRAWAAAPDVTGLTQRDPEEGKPATRPTTIRIVYDDEAIYFGARMEGTPVTALLGRRDTDLYSDWFGVGLDPHHDHRSGAAFYVNPSNVQLDKVLYNDSWDDPDWDAVWSSATTIDEHGWTAELRIPFSQLRFPARDVHVWGIDFQRQNAANNEDDRLVYVPKNESGVVSRFAHLVGLSGVHAKRDFEILPYAVTRSDLRGSVERGDPFHSSSEYGADAGLDVKYGLTSNLTLTGALNPDFGQVEVDPAQVNLSQFELFFDEKRPFFLEGASLFNFGSGGSNWNSNINIFAPSFFYSRRIGREPQAKSRLSYDFADIPNETRILAAGKITGKTAAGWTIGVLDAVTDEERASTSTWDASGKSQVRSNATVEPLTNYLVFRGAKDLGSRGRIGTLFTSVNRQLDDELSFLRKNAYTGGVDGYWAFGKKDLILEGFLGGSLIEGTAESITDAQNSPARYYARPDAGHVELDPTRTSLSGWGGRLSLIKQTGRWRYNLQAQSYSPGFETNDAGFLQRTDITATHAGLLYINPTVGKRIRERQFLLFKFQNWNTAGDVIGDGIYTEGQLTFKNYWTAYGNLFFNNNRMDDRITRGGPLLQAPRVWDSLVELSTDSRKKLFYDAWYERSENVHGGYYSGGSIGVTYRPSSNVSLKFSPKYDRTFALAQYVATSPPDGLASATYGKRYVFSDIEQRTLELVTRLDWTFTSKLSLQLYLQPFIATGDYSRFKEFERPKSFDFAAYGTDRGTIAFDQAGNRYTVDPDGDGAARPFTFTNPDFNLRSVRGSAVLRWEFRPGSAAYFVWNENRSEVASIGDFSARRDLSAIGSIPSDDVFLIKLSYWLPM